MPFEHTGFYDPRRHCKVLTSNEAVKLSELELIKMDLRDAMSAIDLIQSRYSEKGMNSEDKVIGLALLRSAIILWIGCFQGPKVGELSPESVYGSIGEALEFFNSSKDTRDAYLAHRFGPQRHGITVAILSNGIPVSVQVASAKLISKGAKELGYTKQLIQIALDAIQLEINEQMKIVVKEVLALEKDELEKFLDFQVEAPAVEETRISRKQFRAVRAGATLRPSRSNQAKKKP